MGNEFELVELTLMSLKNFQDRELAANVIKKINEYGKEFIPDFYGVYHPLKSNYDENDISKVIDTWMNEEGNSSNEQESYAAGQLLMEKSTEYKVSYQIMWEKDNQEKFNFFNLSVSIDLLKKEEVYTSFIRLCDDLIELIEPVHGEIVNLSFPGWEAPKNLKIRHPELNWVVIFGKPYIELFGREKLLNTPCYKVRLLNEDTFTIQLTESAFEPIKSKVREEIKEYLGKDAFVGEGKSYLAYRNGITPSFDFSEVLFDRTKPIEEPPIRIRRTR